ncbi:MAG: hypothetical protein EOP41_08540 [Sphingobacteriaceae bacterium]|nr:MAG: hypothetical protein EOP41_08540 [Sphingobacteriaceae bacterium]
MESITKIKQQLPHGAQSEIARKMNVSVGLVNRVLLGQIENIDVFNAIADYYAAYKEKKDKALSRLSSLTD